MDSIVIIEDDSSVRDNLIKILSAHGYHAVGAGTGKEGIELIVEENPDLIICDIMLPDTNGYKILEDINTSKKFKTIPFVFLTAKVEMDDLRKGMNLGADDYLTKPFHIKDLLEVVKVRINKSRIRETELTDSDGNSEKKYSLDQRLFLPGDSSANFVLVKDIKYIIADGSSSYLFIDDKNKIMVRKLLKNWENLLPPEVFIRINKNTMINLNSVQKVEKWFNKSYRLFLQDVSEPFVITKQYASRITDSFHS